MGLLSKQPQQRTPVNTNSRLEVAKKRNEEKAKQFNSQHNAPMHTKYLAPEDDGPICVLKIELDGQHVEEIEIYKSDEPQALVQRFGEQFNLSENAKQRLMD